MQFSDWFIFLNQERSMHAYPLSYYMLGRLFVFYKVIRVEFCDPTAPAHRLT